MGKPARPGGRPDPDALVAKWPEVPRRLAPHARRLIRRVVPTAVEVAYPGWNAVGFRDPQSGYFCGLFPMPDFLRMAFEHGAWLRDPQGLFSPGRTMRQVRYVEVRTLAELKREALADLLREAVRYGAV